MVFKQGFLKIVSSLGHFYYFLKLYAALRSTNTFEKKNEEETSPLEPWHFKMIFVVFFMVLSEAGFLKIIPLVFFLSKSAGKSSKY